MEDQEKESYADGITTGEPLYAGYVGDRAMYKEAKESMMTLTARIVRICRAFFSIYTVRLQY